MFDALLLAELIEALAAHRIALWQRSTQHTVEECTAKRLLVAVTEGGFPAESLRHLQLKEQQDYEAVWELARKYVTII